MENVEAVRIEHSVVEADARNFTTPRLFVIVMRRRSAVIIYHSAPKPWFLIDDLIGEGCKLVNEPKDFSVGGPASFSGALRSFIAPPYKSDATRFELAERKSMEEDSVASDENPTYTTMHLATTHNLASIAINVQDHPAGPISGTYSESPK